MTGRLLGAWKRGEGMYSREDKRRDLLFFREEWAVRFLTIIGPVRDGEKA